jgi:2,4-dienoyl-CoA reductase-like NADH-dependent reductase (Old Yellow Enzyme family)
MQPTPEFDRSDLEALAAPLPLLDTAGKTLVAPNRIVYQPMEANDALEDGGPSPLTFARYEARARGGAGVDFVEALSVSADGRARPQQLMITEATKEGIARVVSAYRAMNDETPLLFQLTHSGRFAIDPVTPYPVEGRDVPLLDDVALAGIGDDLVAATRIAYETGADGIDFKHCHGYLLGAMLGPANRARPGWSFGGETLEERSRFTFETLGRMMDAVPPDRFLYTVRLSAFEGIPGGFGSVAPDSAEMDESFAELIAFVTRLEAAGVALVNQSAGVPDVTPELVRQTNDAPDGFFGHQRLAEVIKGAVGVPVVGSGYSYLKAGRNRLPGEPPEKNLVTVGGRAIREGRADMIGVGRQSLADPGFAAKLLEGRFEEILWDTSCNRCAIALRSGIPVGCVTYDPAAKERFLEMRRSR